MGWNSEVAISSQPNLKAWRMSSMVFKKVKIQPSCYDFTPTPILFYLTTPTDAMVITKVLSKSILFGSVPFWTTTNICSEEK